ncbi:MAG TPA: argininosuccinate lyase, partial [Thermoplasmata archaeon]|nr:argininosuccinate lyase [Thermoplasmata archaeon]
MSATVHSNEGGATPSYVRTPAWRFLASLPVDRRLARYDVAGSLAHVEMLASVGVFTREEAGALSKGLRAIYAEIAAGTFPWREDLEDLHTNIEVRLTDRLGPLGSKLHTGRSRNDQIALDERLYLREAIASIRQEIVRLQLALLDLAEAHADAPMPGYTHLQRAQPVTLGHLLLAHFWPLARDDHRLSDAFERANVSPLGAGALAGSTLPIDPSIPAKILGSAGTFENSIDAVGDRDYFAEVLFDLALLTVHLSSIGEELVLWASQEFAFLRPSPALGSGSSLMPQKRNPDVAELARGKAGRIIGDLVGLLSTLKSLPLG